MDTETYLNFVRGLRQALAEKGYQKGEFASAIGTTPQNFSKNISKSKPTMMNELNRFKCASKLGMKIEDIINLGRDINSSIREDGNVRTVNDGNVIHGDMYKRTPREEYFFYLLENSPNKKELLKKFIDILHREG